MKVNLNLMTLMVFLVATDFLSLKRSASILRQAAQCQHCVASLSTSSGCQQDSPKKLVDCNFFSASSIGLRNSSISTTSAPTAICTSIFLTNVIFTDPKNELVAGVKSCLSLGVPFTLINCFYKFVLDFPALQAMNKCIAKRLSNQEMASLRTDPLCQRALTHVSPAEHLTAAEGNPEQEMVELIVCNCIGDQCNDQKFLNSYMVEYVGVINHANHRKSSTKKPKRIEVNMHPKTPSEEYLVGSRGEKPETTGGGVIMSMMLTLLATPEMYHLTNLLS